MVILLTILHVIVAVFLILVVLLQTGKRADLAGARFARLAHEANLQKLPHDRSDRRQMHFGPFGQPVLRLMMVATVTTLIRSLIPSRASDSSLRRITRMVSGQPPQAGPLHHVVGRRGDAVQYAHEGHHRSIPGAG